MQSTKNMLQIKICSGLQNGTILDFDSSLVIGNKDNCELFLLDELDSSYSCTVNLLTNNSVNFSNITNCVLSNSDGSTILVNEDVSIPLSFSIGVVKLLIAEDVAQLEWGGEAILVDNVAALSPIAPQSDSVEELIAKQITKDIQNKSLFQRGKALFLNLFSTKLGKLAIISFLVLVIAAILLTVFMPTASTVRKFTTTVDNSQIYTVRHKLDHLGGVYQLLYVADDNNQVLVSGIVPSNEEVAVLHKALVNIPDINYNIVTSDKAKSIIQHQLSLYGVQSSAINYDSQNAVLSLVGMLESSTNIADLQSDMEDNLPRGIDLDTNQMVKIDNIKNEFNSILGSLSNKQFQVNYDLNIDTITLSGYFTDNDIQNIHDYIGDFKEKYPLLKIKLDLHRISEALPFQVIMVYNGSQPYIVTSDGGSLFVGGVYKGYRLLSISESAVTFMGDYPITLSISDLGSLTK